MTLDESNPNKTALCAVLIGKTSGTAQAVETAAAMQQCPYVSTYTAFETNVLGLLVLPPEKRWWIEFAEEHPEVLGLEQAVVLFSERVLSSSPWFVGRVTPTLEVSPCGSVCSRCPHYQARCNGCPATVYYRPG